jgi:hypothetical protein
MRGAIAGVAVVAAALTGAGVTWLATSAKPTPTPRTEASTDGGDEVQRRNLAQCEQDLHAIHSRGWTYTFEPFGYDYDGKLAIKVTNGFALYLAERPEGTLLWVVQTAECYASRGARWDVPINVIYNRDGDNFPFSLAHYDGQKVISK